MPLVRDQFLYDTQLSTVPWNLFANMTGLDRLNLNLNEHLSTLPDGFFCCNRNLTKLSLRSNALRNLPPRLFSQLPNLQMLQLLRNRLGSLPDGIFHDLRSIEEIELNGNELQTLPGDVFATASSALRKVTLSENPWNCECIIMPFAAWVRGNVALVEDEAAVVCQEPSRLQNVTLATLTHPLCQPPTTPVMTTTPQQMTGATTAAITTAPHWASTAEPQSTTPEWTTVVTTPATTSKLTTQKQTTPKLSTPKLTTSSAHTTTPSAAPTTTSTLPVTTAAAVTTPVPTSSSTTPTPITTDAAPVTSPAEIFSHVLVVLDDGPEIVHYNRRGDWVYLWTVPPSGPYGDFLMTLYVMSLVVGVALLLGGMCQFYRLSRAMQTLAAQSGAEAEALWRR